jgi:hypothetical protein
MVELKKMKMKKCLNILILLLTSFIVVQGQINDSTLKVCCLKESYSSCEILPFTVSNNTRQKIYIAISLEEFTENRWVQITNDIFNEDFSKSRQIMFMEPSGKLSLEWNPMKFPRVIVNGDEKSASKKGLSGKYRFVIEWGINYDSLQKKCISDMFILK